MLPLADETRRDGLDGNQSSPVLLQGLKEEERGVRQLLQGLDKDLRVQGDAIQAFREVQSALHLLCSWGQGAMPTWIFVRTRRAR